MLKLDLQFVEALWPIVKRVAREEECPDALWATLKDQRSLDPVLQNARVDEEGGRTLRLEEWRGIWEAAAGSRQSSLEAGRRQQYALTNARFSIQNAEALGALIRDLTDKLADVTLRIATTASENLPRGAQCASEIRLVAGTTSGGFTDETGVYVDIAVLGALGADPKLTEQFLAHELWHSGHWSLIERHPQLDAPWFMPLAQLQSEGLVNFLIGGTYEFYAHKAAEGQAEERERAQRFLAYADAMKTEALTRIDALFLAVSRLVGGDATTYREYSNSLPDAPGYLHGKYMAEIIDSALGREVLLATCPDPVAFLLAYVQACGHLGRKQPPETACQTLRTIATVGAAG